jgi:hypothetical protein
MAVSLRRIWSSVSPTTKVYIRHDQVFKYHLTAIRYRSSINAELVCCTYANAPTTGRAGGVSIGERTLIQTLHSSVESQAAWQCAPAQWSVWEDEEVGITV